MTLISATTAAVTTDRVSLGVSQCPVTIIATGLSTGEEVAFETSADGGSTWEAITLQNVAIVLSSTNNMKAIYAPMLFRLVKGVTLNPVAVAMLANEEGTKVSF